MTYFFNDSEQTHLLETGPHSLGARVVLQPVPRDSAPAHAAWRAWWRVSPAPRPTTTVPAADLAGRPDLIERNFTADAPVPDVRTRVKAPGHDGVRERAFGSLNYERLYREQNDDALDLTRQAVFASSASGTARVRPQRHGAVG